MISKTDSSIDIGKKVTYVYLMGSKAVPYPRISSSSLSNAVIIRHVNTVNILESHKKFSEWKQAHVGMEP